MTRFTAGGLYKFHHTWTICVLAIICVIYASTGAEAASHRRHSREVFESSASSEHFAGHADENVSQPSDNGPMADEMDDMEEAPSPAKNTMDHENSLVNSLGTSSQNVTATNTSSTIAQNTIEQIFVGQRPQDAGLVIQSRNGSDKALTLPASDSVANENGLARDSNESRKNR